MLRKICGLLIVSGCFVLTLFADTAGELERLKARIAALEAKQAESKEPVKIPTFLQGLEFTAGATFVAQGTDNVNGGAARTRDSRFDASYSSDIGLSKEFSDIGGLAFIELETGEGEGLEDNLSLFSGVNADSNNAGRVELAQAGYSQKMFSDKLALTFGKLDPTGTFDGNEAANDETAQFLAPMFVNNPAIEFPDNGAGITAVYSPFDKIELSYGIFDGNSDWEKACDNLFNIGQVGLKTSLFDKDGNYRFIVWHSNTNHTKWLDTTKEKEAAYGFAVSFDQKLTDDLTMFSRYGWQNPKVYVADNGYSLEHAWSLGLQLTGSKWGRNSDALGFAFGQNVASDDYKDVSAVRADVENHFELYYKVTVNEHLAITPDLQYIINPFGSDAAANDNDVFIGGLRAQVDF